MAEIRDSIAREECISNQDARFLLAQLDAALQVHATILLARHQAAEEGMDATHR